MIDAIKRIFSKPSAAILAQRELEEAERQLLRAQSQAEYYTSVVSFYQRNASRLRGYIQGEAK